MDRRSVRVPGIVWLGLLLVAALGFPGLAAAADPAYPTAFVDTDTIPPITGSTFTVNAGGNIQTAINNAAAANPNLNHEVVIQAGATFTQNLTLPNKGTGTTGWIIVRTSNLAGIAAQQQRIIPATHASAMPKIQTTALYGVESNQGAHHFRFIGIEFIRTGGVANGSLFQIWGYPGSTLASIPHHIVLDRCIVRDTVTTHKLVAIQGGTGNAVIDSYLNLTNNQSGDSNALWMFNGPGPMKIMNNYIYGLGETVFFGAAEYVNGYITEDIEFRRNLVRSANVQTGAGKNIVEWKQGLRIWLAGNIFEDGGVNGQSYNIMMSPQDEGTSGPTAVVDDIIFEYNLFRRLRSGFALSGQGFGQTGVHMTRVAIRHNFIDDVGAYGGSGNQAVFNNGTDQVTTDHNTFRNANGNAVGDEGGNPHTNWIYRNNIAENDVISQIAGTKFGTLALNEMAPTRVFTKNVLVGATATYTGTDLSQNFFPGSISLNADGSLPAGSPYKNQATDGTDIGADFTTLYGTASGVGKFGSGPNDYYAVTGAWPSGPPDTEPPTAPTNLTATPVSASQIDLAWTASTDNVGVTRYRIERCQGPSCSGFSEIATTSVTSVSDAGLSASTSYRYRVRAEDAAGNLSPYSATATAVTNATDTAPPSVALTSPTAGQSVSGVVNLTTSASDNVGVTRVDYLVDGQVVGVFSPPAFTFAWDSTTVANGSHGLSVRAYDAAGNVGTSAPVTVTVVNSDTTPPTASITSPTSGQSVSGVVNVTASASDNGGVTRVDYLLDGQVLGVFSPPAYTFSWNTTTVSNGSHTLSARAYDAAGNMGSSAPVSVEVTPADFTLPTVSLTVSNGRKMSKINAYASDNVALLELRITVNGEKVATTGCSGNTCSLSVPLKTRSLSPGANIVTAVAMDTSGNIGMSEPYVVYK